MIHVDVRKLGVWSMGAHAIYCTVPGRGVVLGDGYIAAVVLRIDGW